MTLWRDSAEGTTSTCPVEAILGPFDAADQGGMFEIVVVFERLRWKSLLTGSITGMVVAAISQYWRMAGYENEAEDWKMNDGTKYRLVSEIVKRYQNLMKSRSSKSEKSLL